MSLDICMVPQKFVTTIGDGVSTTFTVAHGLGTGQVVVRVRDVHTGYLVQAAITVLSLNTVFIEPAYNYVERPRYLYLGSWLRLRLPWAKTWQRLAAIPPAPHSLRVVVIG